jgi:outer membrane receptor for ferrienterochelin and colicin
VFLIFIILRLNNNYIMSRLFLLLVFLGFNLVLKAYTVSGYIIDNNTSETLVYATVSDNNSGLGTTSNEYGFFSLTLNSKRVELRTSYVGYTTFVDSMSISSDTLVYIRLKPIESLQEVTIVGNRLDLGVQGSQMSAIDLPIEQIKAVPAMFGETDVLKALQLLPGVSSGTEGSAGIFVRGGAPDENLFLLDGVPLYNVNHTFGFFSVFNADAIKNVTLYKGAFPAHYAGRLSSIVDVRMKEGDLYKYHVDANIGLISSKINVNGPIIKGKTSFNISLRRTYSDLIVNGALLIDRLKNKNSEDQTKNMGGYYFYDLNAKVTHTFSDNDRLYLSIYTGDDGIYFKYREKDSAEGFYTNQKLSWKWGNLITALRWNHVINPKLFMDASLNYTQYRHRMTIDSKESNNFGQEESNASIQMRSGIFDETAKVDFHYLPTPSHDVRFGAFYTHHAFRPDVTSLSYKNDTESFNQRIGQKSISAHETQLYLEDNYAVTNSFKIYGGLNYSTFTVGGRLYNSLQPRLSARLMFTDNMSFKAGYAYMSQYIHLLSNSSLSLPTDLWVPATSKIDPENSQQVSAGFFYNIADKADLSLEGYYKVADNLLEYKDGSSFMTTSTGWEEKVAMGRGWSYGLEFMLQRSIGKFTGWISYTLSRTQRKFDKPGQMINFGKTFDAKYDRRHDINLTTNYKFSDRFDLSATWVYSTGNCGSIYTQSYNLPFYEDESGIPSSENGGYIDNRNNMRMEPYHRMDISLNFHKPTMMFKHKAVRHLNISVYNAYNNMNPFMVYLYSNSDINGNTTVKELRKITIFPILPTISWGVTF